MERTTPSPDASFNLEELRALTEISLLRLPDEEAESTRATRMRSVVDTAATLTRALASYTKCMLVNCQGSRGTGDLARETDHLHAALKEYADVVRTLSSERRGATDRQSVVNDVDARSKKGKLRMAV